MTKRNNQGGILLFAGIVFLCLSFMQGCADKKAIVVVKGSPEEKGGVQGECRLGEYCKSVTDKLCSEDLEKIIEQADLDMFQHDELFRLICSGDGNPQSVEEYCASLPDETRQRLYRAFEYYGYYINGYG